MNNVTFKTFILALLVAILLLFIVNVGRASYILNNSSGVDSEGGVRRSQLEIQLEGIDETDELMEVK